MRALWRRLGSDRGGTAAVELALIFPVLLTLSLGGFEVTHLVAARARLVAATQAMAEMVAQQSNVDSASMSNFCAGATLAMSPYATAGLTISVASVTRSATGTIGVDWQDTSCGNGSQIANAATLATPVIPSNDDSAIVVVANYAYRSPLAYLLPGVFAMTETAITRPRNVSTITHS
ncbi:MAG: TadE/TadG family type IV pilus assembly protein [Acetobacteraceae bacterium]